MNRNSDSKEGGEVGGERAFQAQETTNQKIHRILEVARGMGSSVTREGGKKLNRGR